MKVIAVLVFAALSISSAGYAESSEELSQEGVSVDEDTACIKGCFKNVDETTINSHAKPVFEKINYIFQEQGPQQKQENDKAHLEEPRGA